MRKRFEYRGMAIVFMVYLAMTAILLLERSGIQYQLSGHQLSLLPRDTVAAAAAGHTQSAECLVLYNSEEEASMQAKAHFECIFRDMKVGCTWVNVHSERLPDLSPYRTATLLMNGYEALGTQILDLAAWVENGGRMLLAMPPKKDAAFMLMEQKLGIVESGYSYEFVDSIRFMKGFMLGGEKVWPITDGYDAALQVQLHENARVYACDGDEKALPLIWRYDYGRGRFVVCNFSYMEKALRGIFAAAYSCLQDAFAYPVINGSAFYLDDFPSPVPSGDGSFVRQFHKMSVSEFYTNVWWPDMMALADKYNVLYTGVVIESYDDDTSGDIVRENDLTKFRYYGDMLLRKGGEIGIHGYNHQPLSLGNVDYENALPYNTWESPAAMQSAVNEVMRFIRELFPEAERFVYVPPSNVLSAEGRALLGSYYPTIHTVASIYFYDGHSYAQEFSVADDGIVEQPRTISGCILGDYALLAALSELNLHLVNNYFIHPDDMLDEDRGAAMGWDQMHANLDNYMHWLYTACPPLRNFKGSELSGAVQRYYAAGVERTLKDNRLSLRITGFIDEAYLLVRLEDKANPVASGGTLTRLNDSLYLLHAQSSDVTITWSE